MEEKQDRGLSQQFPDQDTRKVLYFGPPLICIHLMIGLRRQAPPLKAGGLGSCKRAGRRCSGGSGCHGAGRAVCGPEAGKGYPPLHPHSADAPALKAVQGGPNRRPALQSPPLRPLCRRHPASSVRRDPGSAGDRGPTGRTAGSGWRSRAAGAGALQPEPATLEARAASAALSRAASPGPELPQRPPTATRGAMRRAAGMEEYSAEEEESWYDHQDLEQGERGGEGNIVCPETPGYYSIVGRYHLEKGWAGSSVPSRA